MSVEIKNTVCFHYPNGSPRPTLSEVVCFVKSLDADVSAMEATYRIGEEYAVFIKFKTKPSMKDALNNNPDKLTFHYDDGKAVEVRMSPAGGNVQYVRVYDLPHEITDRDLALVGLRQSFSPTHKKTIKKFKMLRTIIKLAYNKQKMLARNYARRARNPGIDRRMALLNKDQLQTNLQELEQLEEADFSQVHKSHKQYEKEAQHYRERLQSWIVGNKYFKTKQLNFLTWSEKEQIRYLHNFDPEEWSIDKLVESFPADRYTIVKIIKAKWIPQDANRVQRHDETVRENWELFKSGRIRNIDGGFADHLNQFIHRNFQEVQKPKVEYKRLYEIRQQVPEDGEFSQIITSCKKYAKASEQTDVKQIGEEEEASDEIPLIPSKAPNQDMFVMKNVSDRYPKTLRQVKRELGMSTTVENTDESDTSSVSSSRNNVIDVKKYESELISFDASNTPRNMKADIMESIQIPRKLYKKGATYQLDDCFYDDDGEFLYKVPGMTGKFSH